MTSEMVVVKLNSIAAIEFSVDAYTDGCNNYHERLEIRVERKDGTEEFVYTGQLLRIEPG